MNVISVMEEFADSFEEYLVDKINFRDKINNYIKNLEDDIIAAIYIHYVTNKKNNSFWQDFTKNNKMPDKISNFLEQMKTSIPVPSKSDFVNKTGSYLNDYFIKIYYGNGIKNYSVIDQYNEKLYYQYIDIINKKDIQWTKHQDMLELL